MAHWIADRRAAAKTRGHQLWARQANPHREGTPAEVAFAGLYDLPLDMAVFEHGDWTDFNGVELKTSTWSGPDIELKVTSREFDRKRAAVYVLARRVSERLIEFVGAISRASFRRLARRKDYGHGPMLVVGPEHLQPLPDLLPVPGCRQNHLLEGRSLDAIPADAGAARRHRPAAAG